METHQELPAKLDDVDLIDAAEYCRIIGGTRPIHRATLFRKIRAGQLPPLVEVVPGIKRASRSAVVAAIRANMAAGA